MRTYKDDDLTLYEKEIKKVCVEVRNTETVEQAIEVFLKFLHEQDNKLKM